jgi:hypothetical protein
VHQIANCHLGGIKIDYPLVHQFDNCRLGGILKYWRWCTKSTMSYGWHHFASVIDFGELMTSADTST